MELSYLCLALIVCIPLTAFIILTRIKEMHEKTLAFMKDTQVVGGQPMALIEKRVDMVADQAKDERDRKAYLNEEMRKRAMNALG